jgi:hypothetical protein
VTITIDVPTWPRIAALTLFAVGCRQADPTPAASTERAAVVAAMVAACAAESLRPVAAAPAGGLWIGTRAAPRTRVAALIGPASTDGDRARITRRVETLEVAAGSYEPCAESAGEPRIRYLRRDERGAVAIDVMLRRESSEATGLLP